MASLRQVVDRAAKAAVGLFTDVKPGSTSYEMLSGIMPGSIGDPPKRGTREFLAAYSTMPWLRAVTHKVSHAIATTPWKLFVTQGKRDGPFRRTWVECTQGNESGRGRAAQPGIAMDEQRGLAVPAVHELDKLADVLFGWRGGTVADVKDVVHVEAQVAAHLQFLGRCRGEVRIDGADEVARAAVLQDLRNVSQCAHVYRGGRFSLHYRIFLASNVSRRCASEP